ncbi:RidA family protein [Trujillonella endophytica]|uniref:Enamine deaminase RidA, house cleaning of reactive enamine intermediates, YjgF/YER057c/UK114 family n=1 Tax=Trujillonella endophytica TaxID=673521 RepID=A0A1H8VK79_9ACTN|nr:RidA family protein [Trujillella endophytica]SEP15318.1 Enamine deaminase RidA, house cleaning of reactive enamine intermediates, YjgF/YER057c/UK114 family [Trujillella endophytica]
MSEDRATSAVPPQGAYVPAVVHGGMVWTAGMTPRRNGQLLVRGTVGREVDVATAREAAGIAAGNTLTAVAEALGSLDAVERAVKLTVFIAAVDGFTEHAAVADGASAVLLERLGDRGVVARAAIGVATLPSGAPVEVELLAAVRR